LRSPAIPVALVLLAVILAAPGTIHAQPTDADVYVAEAILAVEDKQWDKALGLLTPVLARQPDHVEALYYTGVAYMGKRQPAAAIPFLVRGRQKAPTEGSIGLQLGLAHLALGEYDRAAAVLEEVFAREPRLDSAGYYVGFLRYRTGRWQDALNALRAGRTTDPAIAELTRLYTGLSLQRLGLSTEAEAELAQIGQLRPASPLTAPAERLKSAIATSRETARRFRAQLRAGGFYDDNAAAAPDQTAGDPLVGALRKGGQRTTGELAALTLEYDWLRAGDWRGTVAFSFLGTHNNALPVFDIQDYTGVVRVGRAFSAFDMIMQAGFTYGYDYLVLDNDEFVQRHAMSSYLAVAESARHLTTLQARIEVKEYSEVRPLPVAEFQDGINYLVGVVHFLRFDRDRHFLKAGYQFDVDDTRGRDFVYRGHRLLVGAQYTLPWRDIRLGYDFDVHYRDYLHGHSVLLRERADRDYTQSVRVDVPFPWFRSDQAFFVTGEYINKMVDSNLNAFRYHRNYATITFTWQY
jgi:tetratricopeptide (TPR) repeat protein